MLSNRRITERWRLQVTTMHQCLYAPSQHMAINTAETTKRGYVKARIEVKLYHDVIFSLCDALLHQIHVKFKKNQLMKYLKRDDVRAYHALV